MGGDEGNEDEKYQQWQLSDFDSDEEEHERIELRRKAWIGQSGNKQRTDINREEENTQQAMEIQSEVQDSRTQKAAEVQANQGEENRQQVNENEENLKYKQEVKRFRARMARIRRRFALNVAQENGRSFSVEQEIMEVENQLNENGESARNQMIEPENTNQDRQAAETVQAIYRRGIQGEQVYRDQQVMVALRKGNEIMMQDEKKCKTRKEKIQTEVGQ
ncbi:hypothetical protein PIB30_046358 [Stylosanthes scabra]|uniref:Uncharacterized protein n=1 Tax=Stylosanthes scabra TaxID=79078 RepID=A0ABU6YDQ9_9FABA|nr:hypothetical protein [Stylosanthes scabra]